MYQLPDNASWKGRMDMQYGDEGHLWHSTIKKLDATAQPSKGDFILMGFCSDEGVSRNLGRPGAFSGPEAIRKALSNLAFHRTDISVYDAGNCVVGSGRLEQSQIQLAGFVHEFLKGGSIPIILGGGHETSYGHFKGVCEYTGPEKKVGIINFDPHLDVRTYENGGHSGSWARQLLDEYENLKYFPVGINSQVNIKALFTYMKSKSQQWLSMDQLILDPSFCLNALNQFMDQVDVVAVTLDLDVFATAFAPGVSAPAAIGAFPHHVKPLLQILIEHPKFSSFDVSEMNPTYDDGRTAKLAALFVDQVVNGATPKG